MIVPERVSCARWRLSPDFLCVEDVECAPRAQERGCNCGRSVRRRSIITSHRNASTRRAMFHRQKNLAALYLSAPWAFCRVLLRYAGMEGRGAYSDGHRFGPWGRLGWGAVAVDEPAAQRFASLQACE